MTYIIGDVVISSIQEITVSRNINKEEIDTVFNQQNLLVSGEMEVDSMEIDFTLYNSPDDNFTLGEIKENIKEMPKNSVTGNILKHNGVFYFLSIQDISFSEESNRNNIIEGSINSLAFPSPKNYSEEFSIQEGGYGSGIYGRDVYVGVDQVDQEYGSGTYGIYDYS